MKINSNFVLRSIADNWIALPVGEAVVDFRGMLTLNESGVILWRKLEGGATREELVDTLLSEYDVSRDMAESDVDAFIKRLTDAGCIMA